MIRWHVIKTGPQMEFKAVSRLKRDGHAAFTPIEVKRIRLRGKALGEKRNYPILTRYTLIGCEDIKAVWGRLREDKQVYPHIMQAVLGINRTVPYALSQDEVSYLAFLSEKPVPYVNAVNPHKAQPAILMPGQVAAVINAEHPFAKFSGPVSSIVGKKAHVILELFGSKREVEFHLEDLRAVG